LLDNEYDTNNGTVVDAKMTNGTSGVTYGFIGGTIGRYVNAMKDKDPKYKLAATQFPIMSKGDSPRFLECQREANMPFVAVTTACKDPVAAVKWLDYMYSDEGLVLKNFGVEGVTYNEADGHYVYTGEILHNPNGYSIAEAMARNFRANAPSPGFNQHEDYLMQYYELPEQREALLKWSEYTPNAKLTVLPPLTPTVEESEEIVSLQSSIDTYTSEMALKFIKGAEPMSKYDDFVSKLKGMGAGRYVELNQKALDRYNNR
jgi:putative aldouronate transport system substrate-binding protein